MRNAECGISRRGRSQVSATVDDCVSVNSAFRTPHSALARGSEILMASEAGAHTAGRFGPYGGRYVPETLMAALEELDRVHEAAKRDPSFWTELNALLKDYVGRPTPLTETPRLGEQVGAGIVVALKREDLNHTWAHKINNTLVQALLARRMGKRRIIAETGAGQHGVATATVCARFGLECVVYMGEADMRRQRLNVYRMELMGARVVPVTSGTKTLKDATNEALRDWVTNVTSTHYIIGSVVGPDPFPRIVRDFQAVIDRQALDAFAALARLEGILPALESAHAVAWVLGQRGRGHWHADDIVLINLSGRGDKDVAMVAELTGAAL